MFYYHWCLHGCFEWEVWIDLSLDKSICIWLHVSFKTITFLVYYWSTCLVFFEVVLFITSSIVPMYMKENLSSAILTEMKTTDFCLYFMHLKKCLLLHEIIINSWIANIILNSPFLKWNSSGFTSQPRYLTKIFEALFRVSYFYEVWIYFTRLNVQNRIWGTVFCITLSWKIIWRYDYTIANWLL